MSNELEDKEDYYSVIGVFVIILDKLGKANEECFENTIYLLYLIPKMKKFHEFWKKYAQKSNFRK